MIVSYFFPVGMPFFMMGTNFVHFFSPWTIFLTFFSRRWVCETGVYNCFYLSLEIFEVNCHQFGDIFIDFFHSGSHAFYMILQMIKFSFLLSDLILLRLCETVTSSNFPSEFFEYFSLLSFGVRSLCCF